MVTKLSFNGIELEGEIERATYSDGSLGLVLDDPEQGPERLSINLAGLGISAPEGCVYIKDYSEHFGLGPALVDAGVGKIVGQIHAGPYQSRYWLLKLNHGF